MVLQPRWGVIGNKKCAPRLSVAAELRLERHPAVIEQDLPEIYASIARDDQAAAERVLDAVEAGFSQLTRHSESGVAFPTRNPRLKGMRMLPLNGFPNYLIFYCVEPERVRILYVTHGARHLLRFFRREPRG